MIKRVIIQTDILKQFQITLEIEQFVLFDIGVS